MTRIFGAQKPILGKQAGRRQPRWSVILDVLHWVE